MKLMMTLDDHGVIVFREKWGVLALAVAVGVWCVGFAVLFHGAMGPQAGASHGALTVFLIIYGGAGAMFLLRLPRLAKRVFRDGGSRLVVADAAGITLTANLGAPPRHRAWSAVAEIALVERLRLVDSDETTDCKGALVLFLAPDGKPPPSWFERVQSGVATSGGGRPYLLGAYPRGQGPELAAALRRLAPGTVAVRRHDEAVFDTKTGADSYQAHSGA